MSCDSRFTLAAWKVANAYDMQLVSDFWPHGAIGSAYGVFDEKLGVHTRSTFFIDRKGVARRVVSSPELAQARDIQTYIDIVREL